MTARPECLNTLALALAALLGLVLGAAAAAQVMGGAL